MDLVRTLCRASLALLVASAAFAQTSSGPWRSIGPDGGSILAIVTDPVYPNIVHVATDGGGVFRSTDNGDTWRAAKGVPVTITLALAIAPSNHRILYAGTHVNGIFKSVDGGASWSPTAPPGVLDTTLDRMLTVSALAVDPRDAAVVYAATRGASGASNVLFKTTNGGATWAPLGNLISTPTNFINLTGLRIDPGTPDTLYGFGGTIIVKSVDAGNTWLQVQPAIPGAAATFGFGVLGFDLDPAHPSTLYAVFGNWGVYKSDNAGAAWTSLNATLPFVPGAFNMITLTDVAVDPRNSGTVYVAATCRVAQCPEGAVYKSTNGGTTWIGAHANQGGWNNAVLSISRASPAAIFAGTRCGDVTTAPGPALSSENVFCRGTLLRSTNGGTSWSHASTGLRSLAVVGMVVDPSAPGTIIAASRRGIARTTDAGATWSFPSSTSGMFSNTVAAAPGGRMYTSVATPCCGEADVILHSTDHGLTWSRYGPPGSRPADPGSFPEIYQIAVDPGPAAGVDTVYAATLKGLFKSADNGVTWTRLTESVQASFVAVRPGTPSLLMYSLGDAFDNSIFLSTDGGLTATLMPFKGHLSAVAFDPSSVDTIYAAIQPLTLSCAPFGGLFKSIDRGASWTDAGTGLPPRDACGVARYWIMGLAIDPTNPSRLFAALSGGFRFRPSGIYASGDAGGTWTVVPRPPSEMPATLRFAGSTLVAATFGGSLFALDPSCPTIASPAVANVGAAGGPVSIAIDTSASCNWSASADAAFVTVSGESGTGDGVASLLIAPNAGAPRSATVTIGGTTVLVSQAGPNLVTVDRTSLQFTATNSGAAFTSRTAAQSVRIVQRSPGGIPWTVQADQPWVTVSSTGGTGTATVNIGVTHTFGIPMVATLQAVITITHAGIAESPLTIPVTLTVVPHGSSGAPIGAFDTPANNASGVTGSVPVTGWALDDIEVTRVRIFRDRVAPESPGALIYIGDAVLIDGARPDVAAVFSALPRNTRAGWGYLLLTNFLPGGGNGTVTLHAIADDADGHSTDLGTKVISLDNQNATTPFGTIDTPGQGATVCGAIVNFGWALTQVPKDIAADSSTITVFIDGVAVGQPGVRASRSDIASLFPGYDTSHAVGAFHLDTTQYSNGVHTISWVVIDSAGKAAGIGSRFFTIANPCGASVAAAVHASASRDVVALVDRAPIDPSPILARRGYDDAATMTQYQPEHGRITVHAEELDRIELRLGGSAHEYTGYLRTAAGLMPLPIGSTLDTASGWFAWTPGPGFVGTYDLTFVRWSGDHAVARHDVRIFLHPKGTNRVGPQLVIDAPSAQGGVPVVDRAFVLAGWAADLDSGVDRGVGAVHVWAYPVNARGERELPSFLGSADYGGARPDVAAIYGERFLDTGYGMVARLEPGVYDLAVFAFSTVQGAFAPAQVVTVVVK